jgi:hypothetical protein
MSIDMNTGNAQEPDEVAGFLVELRALGDGHPPDPAPEVAALIGGAIPLRTHPHRRAAVRAALVASLLLAALIGAAAKHSLPQPAQRVVSNVVNSFTPFDIGPNRIPAAPSAPPSRTRQPEPEQPRGDDPRDGAGELDLEASPEATREGDSSSDVESGRAEGDDERAATRTSIPRREHDHSSDDPGG